MHHEENILVYAMRAGVPVHISEVPSGRSADCQCAACGHVLVAKKGPIKIHHFAHDTGNSCSWESALHDMGKRLLEHRIKLALERNAELPISWGCVRCGGRHTGNLLRRATIVDLERVYNGVRPDLLLSNGSAKAIAALEVVVTHYPEQNAIAVYRAGGVEMFTFVLEGVASQDALVKGDPLRATSGTYCTHPKCPKCKGPLSSSRLNVTTTDCWRCNKPMRLAWKEHREYGAVGPDQFSPEELTLARLAGCRINQRYSATLEERYMANECGRCRAFVGQHYLGQYIDSENLLSGLGNDVHCPNCNTYSADAETRVRNLFQASGGEASKR